MSIIFDLERTNQLNSLPDKDLVDLCPPIEPYQVTKSPFLDKEVFTDVTEGERHESDLVAQVKFRGKESFFLIHLEAQESSRKWFNRRMFTYFARFHEKFVLPIYPIVIFSYSKPKREAISQYV
ncbi:MAG: hypothetical protein ACK5QJ_12115, partial [Microcystis sp.]